MNPLIASEPPHAATALSVNVNKVALLRNTRELGIPSVLRAATLAREAGAHGITVHPRPDERHIRAHDVYELADLMQQWPQAEYNIEGNPFHNLMDFIRQYRPQTNVVRRPHLGTGGKGFSFTGPHELLFPLFWQAVRMEIA